MGAALPARPALRLPLGRGTSSRPAGGLPARGQSNCWRCAICRNLPACWRSINGPATSTAARPYFKKAGASAVTAPHLSIRGTVFHAGDWKFIDASLGGVYADNTVYRGVTGWESFEPWLSRIENLAAETVWAIAEIIPPEWYGGRSERARDPAGAAAEARRTRWCAS